MSDLAEKLGGSMPSSDTTARATLAHLRARWGELRVIEGTEKVPGLLELQAMGGPERWRFTSRADGALWFELIREGTS